MEHFWDNERNLRNAKINEIVKLTTKIWTYFLLKFISQIAFNRKLHDTNEKGNIDLTRILYLRELTKPILL